MCTVRRAQDLLPVPDPDAPFSFRKRMIQSGPRVASNSYEVVQFLAGRQRHAAVRHRIRQRVHLVVIEQHPRRVLVIGDHEKAGIAASDAKSNLSTDADLKRAFEMPILGKDRSDF